MLYWMSNPLNDDTVGSEKATLHVLAGVASVGARGNITTLTVLLGPHELGPVAPADVLPQADVSTY
jgi:hypothetical protein